MQPNGTNNWLNNEKEFSWKEVGMSKNNNLGSQSQKILWFLNIQRKHVMLNKVVFNSIQPNKLYETKMVHYKLSYFDARGLAEPIRLLLHYVDDEFEDIRYTRESWPEVKENLESTVFPVLEVEGQKVERGYHILRYLAHKHSLAGKDTWEEAQVDSIADYNREVYLELAPYIYIKAGYKQGIVEEARNDVLLPGIKRHLPTYIKILKESGSNFLVKSGVTWVDFVLAEFLFTMKNMEPEVMKEYPELEAYMKRVYSLPRIKEYVEKRPTREL